MGKNIIIILKSLWSDHFIFRIGVSTIYRFGIILFCVQRKTLCERHKMITIWEGHPELLNLYFQPKYLNISRWIFSLKRKMVILTSHIFLTTGQLYSTPIGRLSLNTRAPLAVRGKREYFIKLYFKMFTFTNNFYFLHKVSSLPSVTLRRINWPSKW